jgi:hypothetical protein
MNRRQQAILIVALIIVVIMLLFPPWYHSTTAGGREVTFRHGHHYISRPMQSFYRIDVPTLLWPIGFICLLAFLAYFEFQDRA